MVRKKRRSRNYIEIGQSHLDDGDKIQLDIRSGTRMLTLILLFILKPTKTLDSTFVALTLYVCFWTSYI